MDKKLLKAYIRTIVEEEVERILPKMIKEQIESVVDTNANTKMVSESTTKKAPISKQDLASLLGITRDGDTLRATTSGVKQAHNLPSNVPDYIESAITRDYSALMKAMNKKN
jgi:hypothetical protein